MTESRLDAILQRIAAADPNDLGPLQSLVSELRPRRANDIDSTVHALRALTYLLRQNPEWCAGFRRYILKLLAKRRQIHLYTDTGIYRNEGVFTAAWRKISHRILPEARNPEVLRDVFSLVFNRTDDYVWVRAVPEPVWLDLIETFQPPLEAYREERRAITFEMLDAVQVLSYRISGIGLEPELVRNYPAIEKFESPFLTQNAEVRDYLESYAAWLRDPALPREDDSHIHVLLDQCQEIIGKIRRHASEEGVSISLTYLLERLGQCIKRLRTLLSLLEYKNPRDKAVCLLQFWAELVEADNRKNSLRDLFSRNTHLIAMQMTEHASRTGEHYVTNTRSEYWRMLRSGVGAGFIVGFMALIKINLAKMRLAPLAEAFAFSMNYSFGFMLIHLLHFTIATKQPAMTASHLAASIHKNNQVESTTDLIVRVCRSQFVAILGNVALAFPTAYGLAWLWRLVSGADLVTVQKAQHMLHDIDPFHSLAIPHAAIAGVCLFLAGLISGYYDNKSLYNRIPERLSQLDWLRRVLGQERLRRFAWYVENNLGALAGNFYFGIMLGSMGTVGYLLGLPLDIRHITFSTANYAYALVALNHAISWQQALICAFGVLAIGMTNLAVSFGLALFVALKARRISLLIGRQLAVRLLKHFFTRPQDFFWPPKSRKTPEMALESPSQAPKERQGLADATKEVIIPPR